MEAIREIIHSKEKSYSICLPDWAIGRDMEIIVLPFGDEKAKSEKTNKSSERMGPLAMLGFAKNFRTTKTTKEWMTEIRDGEDDNVLGN